jgi:serine/threonine protein kinase
MSLKSYLPTVDEQLPVAIKNEETGQMVTYMLKIVSYLQSGKRGCPALAELLDGSNKKVVVKFPNLDESRSMHGITLRMSLFYGDVNREIDAWDRLQSSRARNHIATVFGTGSCLCRINDKAYSIPYFAQEYVEGLSLAAWCESHYGPAFEGIKDSEQWFKLSRKLIEVLGWIHQERVVHGDLWPPNIIIRKTDSEPIFIDFGQAWRIDEIGSAPSLDSTPYPYYAPERLNISEGPWYQPADIYSICGILYYLATGDNPPPTTLHKEDDPSRANTTLRKTNTKKKFIEAIRSKNPNLYHENIGIPDIVLYGLRPLPHERATYAEEILEVLDYYRNAFPLNRAKLSSRLAPSPREDNRTFTRMQELILDLEMSQEWNEKIHHRILRRDLSYIKSQIASLYSGDNHDGRSQLYSLRGGDRDELVKYLLAAISGLRKGDQIFAQTTSLFWRKQNFGANGRLLTILKMAAVYGITVRWVLIIEENEEWKEREKISDSLDSLNDVLQAEQAAVKEVHEMSGIDITSHSLDKQGFYFGFHLVTEEKRNEVVRTAKTFIVLNEKDDNEQDNFTAILPNYTQKDGRIASVRLWRNPNRWQSDWKRSFLENLEASNNVLEYDLGSANLV